VKRKAQVALLAGGLLTVLGTAGCAGTAGSPVNVSAADNNASPLPVGANGAAPAAPAQGAADAVPPAAAAPGAAGPAELVARQIPKMGNVVTNNNWVLYRFDKDTANPPASNCNDTCAKIWPPVLTNGTPKLEGVDANLVGTVTRADGTTQVTLNGWPVYRYAGDTKGAEPPTWKGQKVGNTWWVMDQNGKKNLTCVPKTVPTPIAPPADAGGTGGGQPSGDDVPSTGGNSGANAGGGDYGTGGSGY
jgi:predicted lipoprotein with Yx(FWY)xxD motif